MTKEQFEQIQRRLLTKEFVLNGNNEVKQDCRLTGYDMDAGTNLRIIKFIEPDDTHNYWRYVDLSNNVRMVNNLLSNSIEITITKRILP